jgi:flagellin
MSVINTNIKALAAQGSLSNVNKATETTMERLSTGLRINSAKDDAAGLAITNRMTSQIRGFAVAIRNSNDGISMAQTAEGAMGQVTSMLQRMRELSVQAGNGAMSDADRGNIQQEVTQLKAQIDDVANKTNHNNIKLLDGSAGKITLQTGVYAGDTMDISFGSVKTKDIGLGSRASLAATGTSFTTVTGAAAGGEDMAAGDLLLNGVAVGASLEIDDKLSYEGNDSSAIAKAAAINRVSAQSGVHATVGDTTVHGSVMTAAASSGAITINGVATATVYTTDDAELSRAAVVTAINNISDQTGVRAINTNDDKKGVVLVAADGRNITIDSDLAEAVSGLAATGKTYTGTYELNTLDGRSINVSSNVDGDLTMAGLNRGTYAADTAQSVTTARTVATTAAPGELNGNTLVINGVGIDASVANDDQASYVADGSTKKDSAIAIAAAINKKTSLTGVTATAEPNVISGTDFTAAAVTSFQINGIETIDSATAGAFNSRDDLITAVNQVQGQTGVIAEANGDGIRLIAQDGRNITISSDAAALSDLGLTGADSAIIGSDTTPASFYSTVKLSSDKAFTVDSGSEGNDTNFETLGFHKGTFGGSDNALKIKDIDVTTQQGATDAITAIDAAINSVSADQAKAGAFQNRLDAVVSNLTESTQNMSASRSRILDTDYATETTNLARSQIISQAATAMLAQANQSAQSVLSLLK